MTARPGELVLDAAQSRVLRAGTDVARLRLSPDAGRWGRLALVAPDGRPAAVLELADWLPWQVRVSGLSRGPSEDPLVWSGVQALADAAGLPAETGSVPEAADVAPCPPAASRLVVPATLALVALGLAWFVTAVVEAWTTDRGLALVPLAATTAVSLLLLVVHLRGGDPLPAGVQVAPQPSVPVSARFRRTARLVLVGEGDGLVVVVRDSSGEQEWHDGPASPLGVQRAVVVTPAGADRPERVDLVDGLGRRLVRLPWDQWCGAGEQVLQQLAAAGLRVERTAEAGLGAAAGTLLAPRSRRYPLAGRRALPGAFSDVPMIQLAGAVSFVPVVFWLRGGASTATGVLGLLNGLLLLGPPLGRALVGAVLDRPRP